jgi:hypothetical protein
MSFSTADRPIIALTADTPFKTSWCPVYPEACAGYVSIFAAGLSQHHGLGPRDADLRLQGLEVVPGVDGIMAQSVLPRNAIPMRTTAWTCRDADLWRVVQTDETRWAWLKCGNPAGATVTSVESYELQPGVEIHVIPYAPAPTAVNTQAYGYLDLSIGDNTGGGWLANLRFPTLPPNQLNGGSESVPAVQSRPTAVDPSTGKTLSTYDAAFTAQPGTEFVLRVRVVQTQKAYLVVSGQGLGSPWVIALPPFSGNRRGLLRIGCYGGMWAFGVQQLEYVGRVLTVGGPPSGFGGSFEWVGAGPRAWPQVNPDGAVVELNHYWNTAGSSPTSYVAWAFPTPGVLNADRFSSPILLGVSRYVAPASFGPTNSPTDVSACQSLRLTMQGRRGYRAEMTFATKDPAALTAFVPNGVVTIKAGWQSDESLQTLFVGRCTGPFSRSKRGPIVDWPTVAVQSDDVLLLKQPMMTFSGSVAQLSAKEAITRCLVAAGVDASRIVTDDDGLTDPPPLLPRSPLDLQFTPDTTFDRAMDAICTCRGWVWWIDRFGTYHAGARKVAASPADYTLDKTRPGFLGFVRNIEQERAQDGAFANAICVDSPTGASAVYAPNVRIHDDGGASWLRVVRETDNPTLLARQTYDQVCGKRQSVTWREVWDPSLGLQPEMVIEVVDGTDPDIDLSLASGQFLRLERVVIDLETGSGRPHGEVTLTARLDDGTT